MSFSADLTADPSFAPSSGTVSFDGLAPQNQYCPPYLYVDDVDALAEELRTRGVEIIRGPEDQEYGCREIDDRVKQGIATNTVLVEPRHERVE